MTDDDKGKYPSRGADDHTEGRSPFIDGLSSKALLNVMSYPNPHQETARQRWEMAKGANTASMLPDTADAAVLRPSPIHRENPLAPYRWRPSPQASFSSDAARDAEPQGGTTETHAPLMAGPPGLRQYQPTMHTLAKRETRSDSDLISTHQIGSAVGEIGPAPSASSAGHRYRAAEYPFPSFENPDQPCGRSRESKHQALAQPLHYPGCAPQVSSLLAGVLDVC
jgi:hypothetical protein